MARPLYYDGSNLREMTDAQLERFVYYLQVAYANQISNGGEGAIYVGSSGGTVIGTQTDTLSTQQDATQAAPSNDGVTQTYPAYLGLGTSTGTVYSYRQYQTFPTFPSNAVLDSAGYLYLDSDNNINVVNTEARILSEVLNAALTNMKSDEVGTYRVSSTLPTDGGAGTWTSKGTWFIDTRYNDIGNTTYTLYLKTALDTIPGSDIFPLHLKSTTNLYAMNSIASTNYMTQDVLLPTLTRQLASGTDLIYDVSATAGSTIRGTILDTKYDQATNTQFATGSGFSEVYTSRSTPLTSGTTTTVSTVYLNYLG